MNIFLIGFWTFLKNWNWLKYFSEFKSFQKLQKNSYHAKGWVHIYLASQPAIFLGRQVSRQAGRALTNNIPERVQAFLLTEVVNNFKATIRLIWFRDCGGWLRCKEGCIYSGGWQRQKTSCTSKKQRVHNHKRTMTCVIFVQQLNLYIE